MYGYASGIEESRGVRGGGEGGTEGGMQGDYMHAVAVVCVRIVDMDG